MSSKRLAAVLLITVALIVPAVAGATYSGSSTAYHACDGSTGKTAMGTHTYFGEVANNFLPMGTWIEMIHPARVHGRKFFRVEDTGGPGFLIDIYAPYCAWMTQWGRRNVTIKVIKKHGLWHGKPKGGWQKRYPWQKARWRP